jgi:murein L,D-transpeptidase YcbB/YkuD
VRRALWALALLGVLGCARAAGAEPDDAVRGGIARLLAGRSRVVLGERLREPEALARFYARRESRPAWLAPDGTASGAAWQLRGWIDAAPRHGLLPERYHADALGRVAFADLLAPERRAGLDLLLSDAFLHLARDLSTGATDPAALHPGYRRAGDAPPDASALLAGALASGRVAESLGRLVPPHAEYAALMGCLERLRAQARAGDPGARARADRVRVNLERWRWLPRDLGERHLRVNTPAFTLQAFDAGRSALEMRVVVGKEEWETPLAHGVITNLVLNPAWNVPRSIATKEMLPKAQADPDYFSRQGLEVLARDGGGTRELDPRSVDWSAVDAEHFPYRLRQPPGPWNPLGPIKFVFANPFGVYLHGTPADEAFACPVRALSHGCVRVEDEIALAGFALAPDPRWTRARLVEALRTAQEEVVPLPEPLPVYLLYFTAAAKSDGTLSLVVDPYGWDATLLDALDAP